MSIVSLNCLDQAGALDFTESMWNSKGTLGLDRSHVKTEMYPVATREYEMTTETPVSIALPAAIERFQSLASVARDKARASIVQELKAHPGVLFDVLMRTLLESGVPDRLHDAIDIVSELGPALDYYLLRVFNDQPIPGLAADLNDDYRYVLVRASARSGIRESHRMLLAWSLKSTNRSVREAAVEALAELGDEQALSLLREIAESDDDGFIRDLAREGLS